MKKARKMLSGKRAAAPRPRRSAKTAKRKTASRKPAARPKAGKVRPNAGKAPPRAAARRRTKTLLDLAQVIRSKNAGPFEVTFDVMFDDPKTYRKVKESGVITSKLIAKLYRVSHNTVLVCRPYDPAYAFKITIRRPVGSGDIGDSDVYGCQQHVPLTTIAIPV